MTPIPRKDVKISKLLGSRKGGLLDDALVMEPGAVIDKEDLTTKSAMPAPAAVDRSEDLLPIDYPVVAPVANTGRRISPMVTGRKIQPMARRQLAVVPLNRPVATKSQQPITRPPVAPGMMKREIDGTEIIVQLGRIGDILNILPVCHEVWRTTGKKARLMVSPEFRPLLEGCSYVAPIVFNGKYGELDRAMAEAKRISPNVRVPQVYCTGKEYPRKHENYQRDAWARIGQGHRFEQLSLIFDRRSAIREGQLVHDIIGLDGQPVIAVALDAISVPFPHKQRVIDGLKKDFPQHKILDLSTVRAERFFDLLGIIDAVQVLVACDSAIQHLAQASSTPVVAFRCNDPWRASVRRANHILNRRYSDIDMKEVAKAIKSTFVPAGKIVHVYPDREMGTEETDRHMKAVTSWRDEFTTEYAEMPLTIDKLARDSTKVGEEIATPYVLDLIEAAMNETSKPDDIVLFTNSDIGILPGTNLKLRTLLAAKGAVFCYRHNHDQIVDWPSYVGNVSAFWDGGLDLFAFTRRWLNQHANKLPDLLIGRTGWDLVYRDVVKKTGGGELFGCIWHEKHESLWKQQPELAGNKYNLERLQKYHTENDITRPYDR